jgi:hypothetical protein
MSICSNNGALEAANEGKHQTRYRLAYAASFGLASRSFLV